MNENLRDKRVIFMGTPQIAADVLQALLDVNANVVLAVTQPDRITGRKRVLTPTPVKLLAQEHGIPVFQPVKIRTDYDPVLEARPDLIVTCAYGQLVPDAVLDAALCVNLHGSILPRYRGGAPIQRALWNRDDETGMTLMKMASRMDAGDIIKISRIPITEEDDSGTLFEKLGQTAGHLIQDQLETLLKREARFTPQNEAEATYAPVITGDEEKLDLTQDDETLLGQIRALAPHPGGYVIAAGKKLKLLKARLEPGAQSELHTFVKLGKSGLGLQLKNHVLVLEQVQFQGKPVMDIKSFMNGQGRSLPGTIAAQAA